MNYHGVQISKDKIAEFCRRWKITELALFGSILRDDFRPDSDIDVLVTFAVGVRRNLDDLLAMREELGAVLGRPVDIVERRLVEESPNYIRRKHILSHTETLYADRSSRKADRPITSPTCRQLHVVVKAFARLSRVRKGLVYFCHNLDAT